MTPERRGRRGVVSLFSTVRRLLCRFDHHDYEPTHVTRLVAVGVDVESGRRRMRWTCARCGDPLTLPLGISP